MGLALAGGTVAGCLAGPDGESTTSDGLRVPPFEACGGKACGERCTICDPKDPNCVETTVIKSCQADGSCDASPPACGCPILCGPGFQCVFVGEPPLPTCELVTDSCATVLCAMGTRCENGDCIPVEEPVLRPNDLSLWACGDKLCTDRQRCDIVVGGLEESPPSSSCGDLPPGCVDCSCIDVGPSCVCEASAGHVTVTCYAP